jgi:anaerobic magnesium-protoporphyrin IX monomethyl ester cyclase
VKVTLISPYSDITAYGLRCLSSYLKSVGHRVSMLFLPDYLEEVEDRRDADDRYPPALLAEIARHCQGSGLIGISLMTYCFQRVAQLSDYLRPQLHLPIIWGGIHATIRPEECLAHADFVCRGEGEESLARLAAALEEGQPVTDIPNLAFRRDGQAVINPVAPLVQNLDAFPRPDYALEDHYYAIMSQPPLKPMDLDAFQALMLMNPLSDPARGEIVYQTMASRGCPYHCAFCCNNFLRQLYARQKYVRFLKVESLITELRNIKTRYPFLNTVLFSDDSFFSAPMSWLGEFAHRYAREVGLPFRCLASPLAITTEKLALLTGAGLRGLQIGVQSGSERTRRLYQRAGSAAAVIKAGQILAHFIPPLEPPKYDIIFDNPYETEADLQDTIHLLMRIPPPYRVQPFSLVPIPGTDLYTRAVQDGLIEDERRQVYQKQWHVASNIYFKLLLSLAGSRFPQPLLRPLSHPGLIKLFNRPALRRFLERLRTLKVCLSGRRRTALLTAKLPLAAAGDRKAP